MDIKYPEVEVQLSGENGNAFVLMALVSRALRKAGVEKTEIDLFYEEATSGDYDHVLQTCMSWVSVS